jgi:hypothetical protein
MTLIRRSIAFTGALIVCLAACASAQETSEDTRTEYQAFLTNSYCTVNVGEEEAVSANRRRISGRVG